VKSYTEGSDEDVDDEPLDLSEWAVRDEAGHIYVVSEGSCRSPTVW